MATSQADPSSGLAQPILTGVLIAFIGYAGSVAVVVQGLSAAGAPPGQVATALIALAVAKALLAISFSMTWRMPISIAWTTPGMALLATTGPVEGGWAAVIGAFLATGILIILTGLFETIGRWIQAIPASLANGMLAGILLPICLVPFQGLQAAPLAVGSVMIVWIVAGRLNRLAGLPSAAAVALLWLILGAPADGEFSVVSPDLSIPFPVFTAEAIFSIAVPLFLVTMASQNIPGFTVMSTFGFRPPSRPLLVGSGAVSAAGAFVGMPTVNLAAITAAMACGPESHPSPERRWITAVVAGMGYLAFGALAGITATLVDGGVPLLVSAVAGLALIGALTGAVENTIKIPDQRLPAILTLLVAASGVTLLGLGSAFWALLAGGVAWVVLRPARD